MREAPMGRVIADQSVSQDGFNAAPESKVGNPLVNGGERLHEWFAGGSDQVRDALLGASGAMVMGRVMFGVGVEPWGDPPPFGMPVFVVAHRPGDPLVKRGPDLLLRHRRRRGRPGTREARR